MKRETYNNKGDKYEEKVFDYCSSKGFIVKDSIRAGASAETDLKLNYKGEQINVEIKTYGADWGQKYLRWDHLTGWEWSKPDKTTAIYDALNVKDNIDKNFVPLLYTKPKNLITFEDKKSDQKNFEKPNLLLPLAPLFAFYSNRNTYYIQIEDYGFYHLQSDVYNLGTNQFDGEMKLRLRAKTISSTPASRYGFLAAMKLSKFPSSSKFDLTEQREKIFPLI